MSDQIRIENVALRCTSCGGEQFIQPTNASLEDQITCVDCGQTFQAKELARVRAVEEAKKVALEKIRGMIGKK
jgi:hypothetical protein